MLTNLKSIVVLFALATTFTLASCQSEPIDPQATPAKKATGVHPTLSGDDDKDKPPKDGNGGGGGN